MKSLQFCANMAGQKEDFLVIGRAAPPTIMKDLPPTWQFNKKAWMTTLMNGCFNLIKKNVQTLLWVHCIYHRRPPVQLSAFLRLNNETLHEIHSAIGYLKSQLFLQKFPRIIFAFFGVNLFFSVVFKELPLHSFSLEFTSQGVVFKLVDVIVWIQPYFRAISLVLDIRK